MKNFDLKKLGKFIPIIGLLLFAYVIYKIGPEKIVNALAQIPIQYFALASILLIPGFLLSTYGWYYLCKKQKMYPGFYFLFKTYFIGIFYGNVTPGGIGGHIRILYLKEKAKAKIEKCLTNSMIESSSLFILGLFMSLIGSIFLFDKVPGIFPIILFFFCFHTTSFFVLMRKHTGSKIFKFFIKWVIPKRFKDKIGNSVDALYEDMPRTRDIIVSFLIHTMARLVATVQVYIIALAFSIDVPFIDFFFIHAIAVAAIGILPISPGGVGVREGMFVILLGAYGVAPEIAFAISFTGFLVKMLIPSGIGAIFAFKKEYQLDLSD